MVTKFTFDEIYHSRWLKSEDLSNKDLVVTIRDVAAEEIGLEKELKLIITFLETDKELILNKTNGKTLADRFGKDFNSWIGKRIALYATEVDFGGKITLAIRIRLKTPIQTEVQPETTSIEDY